MDSKKFETKKQYPDNVSEYNKIFNPGANTKHK